MLDVRRRVGNLLFPVKPGAVRSLATSGIIVLLGLSAASCGFHTPGAVPPDDRLALEAAPSMASDPGALDAALAGARDELVASRAIPFSGYPKLLVELPPIDAVPS